MDVAGGADPTAVETSPTVPGRWLVPVQVAAMGAHLLPVGPRWRPPAPVRAAGLLALAGGGALAGAAAVALGPDLTPAVAPRPRASLRTGGVYGWSRHPLYGGLLVASGGSVLLGGRLVTALAAGVLAGVLHVKSGLEERLLAERFGAGWERYAEAVPRLVGVPRPVAARRPARARHRS